MEYDEPQAASPAAGDMVGHINRLDPEAAKENLRRAAEADARYQRQHALDQALKHFAESEDYEVIILIAAAFEAFIKDGVVPTEDDAAEA